MKLLYVSCVSACLHLLIFYSLSRHHFVLATFCVCMCGNLCLLMCVFLLFVLICPHLLFVSLFRRCSPSYPTFMPLRLFLSSFFLFYLQIGFLKNIYTLTMLYTNLKLHLYCFLTAVHHLLLRLHYY